jgi:hypothetical protein
MGAYVRNLDAVRPNANNASATHRSLHIDFKDITGFEVTCSACGASFAVPLPKASLPAYMNCLGCGARLWEGEQDQAYIRMLALMRTLSAWLDFETRSFSVGTRISEP